MSDDVVNRLRCRYASGPIINGEPEFGWRDFGGPAEKLILPTPIMKEAADEIERLRAEVAGLREDAERYREWKRRLREGECALWNALCEGQSDAEHDAAIDAALAARKGEA